MQYRWVVLTVTTVGTFITALDSSIVVVGLPTVIEDLHTTLAAGIWIITAYRLAIVGLLVGIGRLSDIMGRVKLYKIGFVVFTIGSGLCALSPSALSLIAFRFVQGIGAAFVFANSLAIVTDAFPRDQLGTGIGINQMAINAGTIIGYTLSGVMIGLFGWRSLFYMNLPIGAFGTYWAHRQLKEIPSKNRGEKFDLAGTAIFSATLTILLLTMTVGDLTETITQLMILISAMIFLAFVYVERRIKFPVIDMTLFRIRDFSIGTFTNLLNSITFGSLAFSMTLYYQLLKGYGPIDAGLALIPLDITLIFVGPISGRLSDRFGVRGLSTIGLAICAFAFMMLRGIGINTPAQFVILALSIAGFGIGFFRSPNASSVMASVPPERRGIAVGVRSTVINTANLLSVPLAALLISLAIPYRTLTAIIGSSSLNQAEVELLTRGLETVFLVLAGINVVAAGISPWRLRRSNSTGVS